MIIKSDGSDVICRDVAGNEVVLSIATVNLLTLGASAKMDNFDD